MKQPKPKYEIHTLVVGCGVLHITVESPDMAERVEQEVLDYGTFTRLVDMYSICVRPTFELLEVGRWLGRDGIVEVHGTTERYVPEVD